MDFTTLTSEQITQGVRNALDEFELSYQYDKEKGLFSFVAPIVNCRVSRSITLIKVRDHDFYVSSILPLVGNVNNPKEIAELARLIVKINYQLVHGVFNLDVTDGEINFHTSGHTFGLEEFPAQIILGHLSLANGALSENAPKFLGVMFNNLTADEAMELGE